MFDIGFWELMLIAVIGLVVLGPERLPVAIRTVSRWLRAVRNTANSVKQELSQELKLHEQDLKLRELHDNLKQAEQQGMKDLAAPLEESVKELKQAASEVDRPYRNPASQADNRNEP